MALLAVPARAGRWLDTDVPCASSVLEEIAAEGVQGIARYVPLPGNDASADISAPELAAAAAADLQCLLIQHVRSPEHNELSRHDPAVDAHTAASHAVSVGYPQGAHLGLDLEGLAQFPTNTRAAVIAWCHVWQEIVIASGFRALLYVGYAVPLSGLDLYDLPGFNQYWSDAAHRVVAVRGCSMTQGPAVTIAGVEFDSDAVKPDRFGHVPWVAGAAPGLGVA